MKILLVALDPLFWSKSLAFYPMGIVVFKVTILPLLLASEGSFVHEDNMAKQTILYVILTAHTYCLYSLIVMVEV